MSKFFFRNKRKIGVLCALAIVIGFCVGVFVPQDPNATWYFKTLRYVAVCVGPCIGMVLLWLFDRKDREFNEGNGEGGDWRE